MYVRSSCGQALGLQHGWRRRSVTRRAGCVGGGVAQGVRMVDQKHTLPHGKLVLQEGWQGGFVAVPHGWQRAELEVSQTLLPALPFTGHGVPRELHAAVGCPALMVGNTCPSAISETSYLANSSACLKELPQICFFSLLALF